MQKVEILGVSFHNGTVESVTEEMKKGGLLVVPAAPALVTIKSDQDYYDALKYANVVIADSGYMALIWNATNKKKRIRRISGLEFLISFLNDKEVQQSKDILLVDPRKKEADANLEYLNQNGFDLTAENSYLAPMYDKNKVEDPELLQLIEKRKPAFVIVNLGGGVQEKLGHYLSRNLSYQPGIVCTGAAIAFLTGQQAAIPNWADKLYMGWFFRCLEKPKLYFPRYIKAFKLLGMMLRYRANPAT